MGMSVKPMHRLRKRLPCLWIGIGILALSGGCRPPRQGHHPAARTLYRSPKSPSASMNRQADRAWRALLSELPPPPPMACLAPPTPASLRPLSPFRRNPTLYDFEPYQIEAELPLPDMGYIGPGCLAGRRGIPAVKKQRRRVAVTAGQRKLRALLWLRRALIIRTYQRSEAIMLSQDRKAPKETARLTALNRQDRNEAKGILRLVLRHPLSPVEAFCLAGEAGKGRRHHWRRFLKQAPSHPAAAGVRLRLALGLLKDGRYTQARQHLAQVQSAMPKVQLYQRYLLGWADFLQVRYRAARKTWLAVRTMAVKRGWKFLSREAARVLIQLLSRTLGSRPPASAVLALMGPLTPTQQGQALMRLAKRLVERGEEAQAISAFEAARRSGGLKPRDAEQAFLSILESLHRLGRQDLLVRRLWGYLASLGSRHRRLPSRKTRVALETLVRHNTTELHALAARLRNARYTHLASLFYLLWSVVPDRHLTPPTRRRMKGLRLALAGLRMRLTPPCSRIPAVSRPRGRAPARRPIVISFSGRPRFIPRLNRATVRRIVRRHLSQIQGCYVDARGRAPSVKGRLLIRFLIGTNGGVHRPRVIRNTSGDSRLGQCIRGKVARWQFPETSPKSPLLVVQYPFDLLPLRY